MRLFRLFAVLCLLVAAFGHDARAAGSVAGYREEAIRDYAVRIAVERDGSIVVTEDIDVVALGYEIKRGIYRDIPLGGSGLLGLGGAKFDLIQTLRDGRPEPSHIERSGGNVRIYLGQSDVFLKPGEYSYRIVYKMSNQVRRFEDFDEIYWNATGNEWVFPIEHARVVVVPPAGAPALQAAAYTGYYGSTERGAAVGKTDAGEPTFRTTRELAPGEGLTVAVGWPPGYLDPITSTQRLTQWLERWGAYLAAGFAFGVVLVYYLIAWLFVGRDPSRGTVIPVYHPNIPPAAMRFIENMRFDNTCFSAAIINLAVKGHLKIKADKSKQTLIALDGSNGGRMSDGETVLFDQLFSGGEEITIQRSSRSRLNAAVRAMTAHFEKIFNRIYFRRNRGWFVLGVIITIVAWLISSALSIQQPEFVFMAIFPTVFAIIIGTMAVKAWKSVIDFRQSGEIIQSIAATFQAIIVTVMLIGMGFFFLTIGVEMGTIPFAALIGVGLLNVVFWYLLKAPTALGRGALDEIEGTRLYLTVAEEDRLKFANPPDKTPEHFHELLPYAIALDLETAWTDQFKAEIEAARATDKANPYLRPSWYSGSRGSGFSNASQLRSLGPSLGSAVAAATVTRSSGGSGSGGGGSSGGGGGGGGGGGW